MYSGMACDEAYSRCIEHISRKILIVPAICMFDKHLSKFMNARIITEVFTVINNKIYRENLSTLDLVRLFIGISLLTLLVIQLIAIL